MCKHAGLRQASIRELLIAVNSDIESCEVDDIGFKFVDEFHHLESVANGCPACMLFVVRLAEETHWCDISCNVDYQERKKSFWLELNRRSELASAHG